jgi:hypothetical protein
MSGAVSIRFGSGELELPEESTIPFYERAKIVFNSPYYTPVQKEKKMFELYFAEFKSHEHNQHLDEKTMKELATQYTVEMILSLNDGTI